MMPQQSTPEQRMPEDWFLAGYEAALRGDHDAMCATLTELSRIGRGALKKALRVWMNRTENVMGMVSIATGKPVGIGFQLEADNGDGEVVSIDEVAPNTAWAGRIFVAYMDDDVHQFDALWDAVPDTHLTDAVYAALNMVALTAVSIGETVDPVTPSGWPGPLAVADREARAHLN